MPPSTLLSLRNAIDLGNKTGNTAALEGILQDRDANGNTKVDLNADIGSVAIFAPRQFAGTLEYAARPHFHCDDKLNSRVFQLLLDCRDRANNMLIDPNVTNNDGRNVVDSLILLQYPYSCNDSIPFAERREISRNFIGALLDTRRPDGTHIFDTLRYIRQTSNRRRSLLRSVMSTLDPQLLQMFLDYRDVEGRVLLTPNEVWDVNGQQMTPLDYITQPQAFYDGDALLISRNDEMARILRNFGGRPYAALRDEDRRQPLVFDGHRPAWPQPAIHQNPAVQAAIINSQNTHDRPVTVSVSASVERLMRRYPDYQNEKVTALTEIKTYLNGMKLDNSKKIFILSALDRIETDTTVRLSAKNLTLADIATLVWMGVQDQRLESLPEDILDALTPADIECRKRSFLDKLHEMQTTYGPGSPACFVGSFNKILETLDRIHIDVTIINGSDIKIAASNRILILIREFLESQEKTKIVEILRSWNDVSDHGEDTIADVFKATLKKHISEKLIVEFDTLLYESDRHELLSAIDAVGKPILDPNLRIGLQKLRIERNYLEFQKLAWDRVVGLINMFVEQNYIGDEKSTQENLQYQKMLLTYFEKMNELKRTIEHRFEIPKGFPDFFTEIIQGLEASLTQVAEKNPVASWPAALKSIEQQTHLFFELIKTYERWQLDATERLNKFFKLEKLELARLELRSQTYKDMQQLSYTLMNATALKIKIDKVIESFSQKDATDSAILGHFDHVIALNIAAYSKASLALNILIACTIVGLAVLGCVYLKTGRFLGYNSESEGYNHAKSLHGFFRPVIDMNEEISALKSSLA